MKKYFFYVAILGIALNIPYYFVGKIHEMAIVRPLTIILFALVPLLAGFFSSLQIKEVSFKKSLGKILIGLVIYIGAASLVNIFSVTINASGLLLIIFLVLAIPFVFLTTAYLSLTQFIAGSYLAFLYKKNKPMTQ